MTRAIESSLVAKWIEFQTAVFKYASLEEKRAVKSVMTEYKPYTCIFNYTRYKNISKSYVGRDGKWNQQKVRIQVCGSLTQAC